MSEGKTLPMDLTSPSLGCAFCGADDPGFSVRTGVTAYASCYLCLADWETSDKTLEALDEIRERGGRLRIKRERVRG